MRCGRPALRVHSRGGEHVPDCTHVLPWSADEYLPLRPIRGDLEPCWKGEPAVDVLSDGRVALAEGDTVSLWADDGSLMDGWPVTVDGRLANECQPSPCMPGGNGAIAPVSRAPSPPK